MNNDVSTKDFELQYGRIRGRKAAGRRVVVLAYPHIDLLDFSGPVEVLHLANLAVNSLRSESGYAYETHVLSANDELEVMTGSGIRIRADGNLFGYRGSIQTLMVPGGETWQLTGDERILKRIAQLSSRASRTVSVCSGALILAAAGLLSGRRATTHWRACQFLENSYPDTVLEPDSIFVQDGNVYTSAGSTAGIDLMLQIVENDLGRDIAMHVARDMVVFLRRSGGQAQFSETLKTQVRPSMALRDLFAWIANNLAEDLRVEILADKCNMSLRNFVRQFPREVGSTPAKYVESVRVESARQMLEQSACSLDEVAATCGFGSADSMRRSFLRTLGVSPNQYRKSFNHQR